MVIIYASFTLQNYLVPTCVGARSSLSSSSTARTWRVDESSGGIQFSLRNLNISKNKYAKSGCGLLLLMGFGLFWPVFMTSEAIIPRLREKLVFEMACWEPRGAWRWQRPSAGRWRAGPRGTWTQRSSATPGRRPWMAGKVGLSTLRRV